MDSRDGRNTIPHPMEHFRIACQPQADPRATVRRGCMRATVLSPGIVRIEHDPASGFEDRPSQHFWHRMQPVPDFSASESGGRLVLRTGSMALDIPLGEVPRPDNTLVNLGPSAAGEWRPVDSSAASNLGGCLRTLDTVRGRWDYKKGQAVHPGPGLIARDGWSWVDDSGTLAFDAQGFLVPRRPGAADWYVFAYGSDYNAALRDYHAVAGAPPLLPRWALGLWWSKWEPFKQSDLERIVADFESHGVPLSVCVVDMDWHLPGWTGYTWNKEFFPDPRGFLEGLHRRGVHACLNLHPADGVHPHEEAHSRMAAHMGVDPASGRIPFDLTDRRFLEGYFRHLHHPLEEDGVDFWWMDWQQGTKTTLPGLDPLWYLNHLHARDLARDGKKRPFAFSRWGGWGSHRYPIGFSGDSSRTWETLGFEIELTAQSANSAFGWWSHDIAGFCDGFPDDELYVRWIQFGVLSPVFRFHNCGDPTLDYRPWTKNEKFRDPALAALRLRRSLVPYLYTAARRNHLGAPPPCLPMYYEWPNEESAYHCPGQYLFGPSLLAAPHDAPVDSETNLARKVVWLPAGDWFDFRDGTHFSGGRWIAVHGTLEEIPLFARGGHAVPLTVGKGLEWLVFPGAGNSEFYDDDGETMEHEAGASAMVTLSQECLGDREFRIRLAREGDARFGRGPFRLRLRGFADAVLDSATLEGGPAAAFQADGNDWVVDFPEAAMSNAVVCRFDRAPSRKPRWSATRFWRLLEGFRVNCHVIRQMRESKVNFAADIQRIAPYRHEFTESQFELLAGKALDCGLHWRKETDTRDFLVWWNPSKRPDFTVRFSRSVEWLKYREVFDRGDTDGQIHVIEHTDCQRGWTARVNFADLAFRQTGHDKTARPENEAPESRPW